MLMKLSPLDFAIIAAYFCLVLGVGYWLKDKMKTSSDFLLSNRTFSHWITGIAFMSANLGALEVMGHTANGAKYGMRTNHWYWIGAIPAMVFLGHLHGPVLLRERGAQRAGVPADALRPSRPRHECFSVSPSSRS